MRKQENVVCLATVSYKKVLQNEQGGECTLDCETEMPNSTQVLYQSPTFSCFSYDSKSFPRNHLPILTCQLYTLS